MEEIMQTLTKDELGEIEYSIDKLLCRIGMPVCLKGYSYARLAIIYAIQDSQSIYKMTKQIYPMVARTFNTTSSRVERAIRHAVERTWETGTVKQAVRIYGYLIRDTEFKPTNSEFIAEMAEIVKRELKISNYAV